MATYRYFTADLRSGAVLEDLPLADVDYETLLMGHGKFSATLDLGDPRVVALRPARATIPARTAVYVERDKALVWGGILWTRRYSSTAPKMILGGAEFSSYLERPVHHPNKFFANEPIESIFAYLVNLAMGEYAGNIGILPVVTGAPTGVSRQRTYIGGDLKPIMKLINEIADEPTNGFEWANEVGIDLNDNPVRMLRMSFPRRGRSMETSGLVWEYPGNVADYEWDEDGSRAATVVVGVGRGYADSTTYTSSVDWPALITEGWPNLVAVLNTDLVLVSSLQGRSDAELTRVRRPIVAPKLNVRATAWPALTDYTVGDRARLLITDPTRFEEPVDAVVRLTGRSVRVGRDGEESVSLTVDDLIA